MDVAHGAVDPGGRHVEQGDAPGDLDTAATAAMETIRTMFR